MEDIAKSIVGAVGKEFYADAIQPSAKNLGRALATVADSANVVALPFKALNIAGQRFDEWLTRNVSENLKDIDDDEIVVPNRQVFIQAIQSASICYEADEIKQMFSNLVAATLCKSTKSDVHPSYPDILRQLNSYEAKLLKYFFFKTNTGSIVSETVSEYDYDGREEYFIQLDSILSGKNEELADPVQLSLAIDNLSRLKLISTTTSVCPEYVEQRAEEGRIIGPEVRTNYEVDISFTSLGWLLLECCVSKKL